MIATPRDTRQIDTAAYEYLDAGLCPLPAEWADGEKRPLVKTWTEFRSRRPTDDEMEGWFGRASRSPKNAVCLVCGPISGGLEVLDFDMEGEVYAAWEAEVRATDPDLLDRLVIERSPSGGFHVVYRHPVPDARCRKLAERDIPTLNGDEIVIAGKKRKPVYDKATGTWSVTVCLIETRADGGVFLCHPSPGYELVQGELREPPMLTRDERDLLVGLATTLNERPQRQVGRATPVFRSAAGPLRPGDDFNRRGDVRELLQSHGWTMTRPGVNEHWCRPGKDRGTSATLKDGVFYVFSSNASPFEPATAYTPFAVMAFLEHGGDFAATARALAAEGYGEALSGADRGVSAPLRFGPLSLDALLAKHDTARDPVIEGLLRLGETMNIIAPPKTGKSWLVSDLAMAVAQGRPWLGRFPATRGRVLILDNELHDETIATRYLTLANARNQSIAEATSGIEADMLRGRLRDLHAMSDYFHQIEPGRYRVIILDAFYRFLPNGTSENDNGSMAGLYNALDIHAARLGCSFILIHHTSKGNQSDRALTDIGAGAGAQSRAADTHLVLRPHREPDAVVLDATTRSWPPIQPVCLRWKFPVWEVARELDPTDLRASNPRRDKSESAAKPQMTPMEFAHRFVGATRTPRTTIVAEAKAAGVSKRDTADLLKAATNARIIERTSDGVNREDHFILRDPVPAATGASR